VDGCERVFDKHLNIYYHLFYEHQIQTRDLRKMLNFPSRQAMFASNYFLKDGPKLAPITLPLRVHLNMQEEERKPKIVRDKSKLQQRDAHFLWVCPQCEFHASSKSSLQSHVRTH
jgi:hypothetical protein